MFPAPSVDDILLDLRNSVKAEVAGTDPWIWPNNLVPVLKALAQAMRANYLRLEFIHKQAFVTTAQQEYLDYHGIQTGGLSRSPAQFAQGNVSFDGVLGTVIPDGTMLARADGSMFMTVGTITLNKTPLSIYVRAVDSGELGNTDSGALLTLITPIAGINSALVDVDGLIGGAEGESDDSFRQRILYFKQNPSHGGSPYEYVEWCQTKTGVTRVFVQRATPAAGSVTIYFMMDGIGDGVPLAADVDELSGILEQLAPSDANIIVLAPTPQPIDISITGLVPDTADIRNAMVDELKAMFIRQAEPASVTTPFVFSRSWIDEAIAMTPKWRRSKIITPADDVTISTAGNIPVLGTISFV